MAQHDRTTGRVLGAAGAALAALGALACGRADRGTAESGQQLAAQYCQGCHVLPSPALLDRASWDRYVLPRMARRLGLSGVGDPADLEPLEAGLGGRIVRAAHVFSDSALLSRAEWDRLAAYYLRGAPVALPAPATPAVSVGLPGFRVRAADFHVPNPNITLVQVDAPHRRVYLGDATPGHSTLNALDGRGRLVATYPTPSPVSNLRVSGDTLSVLLIGQLSPSDVPRGSLVVAPGWRPGAAPNIVWQVDTLRRPVFASYADLNGDSVEDAVVSEFGNLTGRLAWYERLPGGGSRRHLLTAEPGALTTVVRDFDGDGRPDVLALTGQANEGVWLFRGRPGGAFVREPLLRFPPSYGSAGMEVADVNGDGHPDIVYANGDAGDYPAPVKPYHGVHVYLNDGRGKFTERYFFPMPGAYKAVARDFDGDGDVDLAAIAFYPAYAAPAPLAFVYLENEGGLRFRPRTFADANRGRWLTMDAGDLDGDGDDDLVLGSFTLIEAEDGGRGLSRRWHEPGAPTALILENTAKHPPRAR